MLAGTNGRGTAVKYSTRQLGENVYINHVSPFTHGGVKSVNQVTHTAQTQLFPAIPKILSRYF